MLTKWCVVATIAGGGGGGGDGAHTVVLVSVTKPYCRKADSSLLDVSCTIGHVLLSAYDQVNWPTLEPRVFLATVNILAISVVSVTLM